MRKKNPVTLCILDANNLYGWAMSQKLPYRNLRWVACPEYINLDSYDENSAKGPILEVDLEYPPELHHLHNDYPLAPEKMFIKKEMLLDYSREILEREKMTIGGVSKLINTLSEKKNCPPLSKFTALFEFGSETEKNSSSSRIFTK